MILGILQARFSSTRLPGKVMAPILGEPMLARQIERVRRARRIDQLVVATSLDSSDDQVAQMCQQVGVACFRGSLNDVLDRFYQAALGYSPEHIVRLTGDCPLSDPELIDQMIDFYLKSGSDYVSNTLEPTYPDGLDAEVFRFTCLEQAWREADLPSAREHVTPFLYRRPELFRIGNFKSATDYSNLRWTVDEADDLKLVRTIYEALYPSNSRFNLADILAWLDRHREWKIYNTTHARNEGLAKSKCEDQLFLSRKKESNV